MKNILAKIDFHYSFIIMAFGLVLTGHFSNLIVFTSIIIVHEMGHYFVSYLFGYEVEKIIIYPYGGLLKLNTMVNTNIYKDLIVAISGLLMQCIYFYFIFFLYKYGIVREYIYNLFYLYHRSMLLFNILPIIPLDGSKIINLILSKYFNFNLANRLTVFISFITIIIVLVTNMCEYNYSLLLTIGVLLQNIYNFYSDISFVYNRFLIERYLYNINYKDKIIIEDKDKMFKNKMHLFNINGKFFEERDYLNIFFKKKY